MGVAALALALVVPLLGVVGVEVGGVALVDSALVRLVGGWFLVESGGGAGFVALTRSLRPRGDRKAWMEFLRLN